MSAVTTNLASSLAALLLLDGCSSYRTEQIASPFQVIWLKQQKLLKCGFWQW